MSTDEAPNKLRQWKLSAMTLAGLLSVAGMWGYEKSDEARKLAEELVATQIQLREASKPDLPIQVSFRQSFSNKGLVAMVRNQSNQTLELAGLFSSANTGQQRSVNMVLPASGVQEFGHREGWVFSSGQRIRLENAGFRPAEYVVPTS
jgi:hypothetical protein